MMIANVIQLMPEFKFALKKKNGGESAWWESCQSILLGLCQIELSYYVKNGEYWVVLQQEDDWKYEEKI